MSFFKVAMKTLALTLAACWVFAAYTVFTGA